MVLNFQNRNSLVNIAESFNDHFLMLSPSNAHYIRKINNIILMFSFLMFVSALGNLGSVLSSQGRYIEAKEALQLALKYRPNMADVHYNL